MASSVDIAPALGHPVLTTQLGVGSTPGYDAVDLRRAASVGRQEGVHYEGAGSWLVQPHTPNGMQVDVSANVGLATVKGDTVSNQGYYVVAPHSGVATIDIAAADATNPRIDQVVLRVYDTAVDGLGFNKATLTTVAGTPTSGATLDNRNGTAALPNTALRLADVLVGAGATSITSSSIRDRRKWANGFFQRAVKTDGSMTPGPGPTEIGTNVLKFRGETGGNLVVLQFAAVVVDSSGTNSVVIGFYIDGALPDGVTSGGTGGFEAAGPLLTSATFGTNVNLTALVKPSSGSHLYSIWLSHSGANPTVIATNSGTPSIFTVKELVTGTGETNGTT